MKKETPQIEFVVRLSVVMTMRYLRRPARSIARLTAMLMVFVGALPVYALEPTTCNLPRKHDDRQQANHHDRQCGGRCLT